MLPKLDVVAVITGVVPDDEKRYPFGADRSDRRRGEVGQAAAARSRRRSGAECVPAQSRDGKGDACWPGSDLVNAVSDKTWRFGDNELRIRAVGLNLAGETPTFELTIYSDKPGGQNTLLSEPIGLDGRSRGKLAAYALSPTRGVGWTAAPLCSNAASWGTA